MIFYETFLGSQRLINNRFKILRYLRTGTQAKNIYQIRDINTAEQLTLYLFDVSESTYNRIYFFDYASRVVGRKIRHFFFTSSPFYFLKGPNEFGVAIDWCDGHDFYYYTADMTLTSFREAVLQLSSQLVALHALDIYHLDLKEDNILYRNGGPCIIDFGSAMHGSTYMSRREFALSGMNINSRILQSTKSLSKFEICSTDMYRPPETLVQLELHDSFALGYIIYHCLTSEFYVPAKRYIYLYQFQRHFGYEWTDLCFGLTDSDERRYTAREILQHPALTSMHDTVFRFKMHVYDSRRAALYEYLALHNLSFEEEETRIKTANPSEPHDDQCTGIKITKRELLRSGKFESTSMSLTSLLPSAKELTTERIQQFETESIDLSGTLAYLRHYYWETTQQRLNRLEGDDSDVYSETQSRAGSSISIFIDSKNYSLVGAPDLDFEVSDAEQHMHELECDLSEFHLDLAECDFSV